MKKSISQPEKSEVNRLLGSNKKIKALTSWKQNWSFSEGLGETIKWMRDHWAEYKTDIYNV